MTSMYIAEGCLVEATSDLEDAIIALENHADNGPPELVGTAYRHLLRVRGQLTAMRQMLDLRKELVQEAGLTVVR